MKFQPSILLVLATGMLQTAFSFKYDAREIKPYFSLNAEFRNMKVVDLDRVIFSNEHGVFYQTQVWNDKGDKLEDDEGVISAGNSALESHFKKFGSESEILDFDLGLIGLGGTTRREVIGAGLEAGVFYRGLQVGIGFTLLQRQVSEPNTKVWSCNNCVVSATDTPPVNAPVAGLSTELWNASYSILDYELVVGYELLPEGSFFQVIPRMGMGVSVLNIQFPGAFSFYVPTSSDPNVKPFTFGQQDYSSTGISWRFETEARWTLFSHLGLGAFTGYRFTNFDSVDLGEDGAGIEWWYGANDIDTDNFYIGAKIMIIFDSFYEKEAASPIR